MKRLMLPFVLAFALAPLVVNAQTPAQAPDADSNQGQVEARHTPDPDRQTRALAKKLNLTPDQASQIRPIIADRIQQMQAIRADNSLSPKDRHAKMHGISQDSDAKVKAVLSDAQKQQYDQLKQEMRQRREQNKPSSNS